MSKEDIAELKSRIAALEAKLEPTASVSAAPPRPSFQRLDRLSMPPSAMADLVAAVPSMSDIVADSRRGVSQNTSISPEKPRGTGWIDPLPLKSPPGIDVIDKLVDAQDRRDLRQRLREEGS
jgi:hypothetical protein